MLRPQNLVEHILGMKERDVDVPGPASVAITDESPSPIGPIVS